MTKRDGPDSRRHVSARALGGGCVAMSRTRRPTAVIDKAAKLSQPRQWKLHGDAGCDVCLLLAAFANEHAEHEKQHGHERCVWDCREQDGRDASDDGPRFLWCHQGTVLSDWRKNHADDHDIAIETPDRRAKCWSAASSATTSDARSVNGWSAYARLDDSC
jgi:hypothetical protein